MNILIWRLAIEDPAATEIPIYYQVCLHMLNVIWISLGVFFLVSLYYSYKAEESDKTKGLYIRLASLYGPWMIGLPISVFLVLTAHPWDREITVKSFHLILTFFANAFMIYITWPSRVLNYFSVPLPKINYDPTKSGIELVSDFL